MCECASECVKILIAMVPAVARSTLILARVVVGNCLGRPAIPSHVDRCRDQTSTYRWKICKDHRDELIAQAGLTSLTKGAPRMIATMAADPLLFMQCMYSGTQASYADLRQKRVDGRHLHIAHCREVLRNTAKKQEALAPDACRKQATACKRVGGSCSKEAIPKRLRADKDAVAI